MLLEVSQTPTLVGHKHFRQDFNQLYRPSANFPLETISELYCANGFESVKFRPILLKEWFWILKPGGYLIVDYQVTSSADWTSVEDNLWWLLRDHYEIVFHDSAPAKNSPLFSPTAHLVELQNNPSPQNYYPHVHKSSKFIRLVCKKTLSQFKPNDTIKRWTFGIITNGQREEWTNQIISSIRSQNIPQYEIIICGVYSGKIAADMHLIPFQDRDEIGWITRKKNLIAQKATYENLCLVHNRMVLGEGWYKGMLKWGNAFEVLNIPQTQSETNYRGNHWQVSDLVLYQMLSRFSLRTVIHFSSDIDSVDWYENIIQYGQAIIIKKSLMLRIPQNETLYWGAPEDHVFSQDLVRSGKIIRLNPFSSFINLDKRPWHNNAFRKFITDTNYSDQGNLLKIVYRSIIRKLIAPFMRFRFGTNPNQY